jgi:hypothetical protein
MHLFQTGDLSESYLLVDATYLGRANQRTVWEQQPMQIPLCLHCRKNYARHLALLSGYMADMIVFCSVRCAARHALEQVVMSKLSWCAYHQAWHDQACEFQVTLKEGVPDGAGKQAEA